MSELSTENSKQKRGLGRGLGSLLGGASEIENQPTKKPATVEAASITVPSPTVAAQTEGKVWQVGIDKLKSGIYQPRKTFEKESLQELAQSIKENGILQPIIVRKTENGSFEIVAGERRWRAAQLAGMHEVPVLIRAFNDKEALELAIVENIQREDLNPIEEAEGYSRLSTEFSLSQQQIAEKVGKDRATIANSIRLLALPRELKELVIHGELSVGHAKVLLSLQDPKAQIELAKRVVKEKLPVRKLEKLIAAASDENEMKSPSAAIPNTMNQLVLALSDELQKMLGTKVQIDYADGKGKIKISFYSNEELNNIVDGLKRGCQR
jgi:ParB family chromosome partitioning protein